MGKSRTGSEALVEGAHLAVAGEEAEGAAAGDGENALDAAGGGLGEFGIAGVGHVGRQIEEGLLAVAKVRRDDELAGFSEAEAAAKVLEAALTVSVAEVRTTVGIWSKTSSLQELGNVDGRGLDVGGTGLEAWAGLTSAARGPIR